MKWSAAAGDWPSGKARLREPYADTELHHKQAA